MPASRPSTSTSAVGFTSRLSVPMVGAGVGVGSGAGVGVGVGVGVGGRGRRGVASSLGVVDTDSVGVSVAEGGAGCEIKRKRDGRILALVIDGKSGVCGLIVGERTEGNESA